MVAKRIMRLGGFREIMQYVAKYFKYNMSIETSIDFRLKPASCFKCLKIKETYLWQKLNEVFIFKLIIKLKHKQINMSKSMYKIIISTVKREKLTIN